MSIIKIGGVKNFLDDLNGKGSDDQDLYKRFVSLTKNEQIIRGGYWRFHIVPKEKRKNNYILNAIELTNSSQKKPGTIKLISNPLVFPVILGPNLIILSKKEVAITNMTVSVDNLAKVKRIIMLDLIPYSNYSITYGKKNVMMTSNEAGLVDFLIKEKSKGKKLIITRLK